MTFFRSPFLTQTAMSGYSKIAPHYTHLFPLSDEAKGFLEPFAQHCVEREETWLDVGCGTGNLLVWLFEHDVDAYGLEPDADFVAEAKRRIHAQFKDTGPPARRKSSGVIEGFMGSLGGLQRGAPYGVASWLGNTLAHAANLDEVKIFFQDLRAKLTPDGTAIVQIVNYDKVLATPDWQFPVLRRVAPDGTELVFHRTYTTAAPERGGMIRFETVLCAG
ncbi:MAG: methyltransferase, partial [bacterium]